MSAGLLEPARIEAAAPDQASLNAASKLMRAELWPLRGREHDASLLWGQCQGSGAAPYKVAVATVDLAARCTCPSRKFPCKHALALMWWAAREPGAFVVSPAPEWVAQWGARQGRGPREAHAANPATTGASLRRAAASREPETDSAKSATARARNEAAREQAVADGLDALDAWLADQLDQGLAGFATRARAQIELLRRRLVDAKAPALAGRIETLPERYFAAPEPARGALLLEELGLAHLLGQAHRRRDALPARLRADVRRAIGWSERREALLQDADALRIEALWHVLAVRREPQPDRLLRIETWLTRDADPQRYALLLDYVPQASASEAGPGLRAGEAVTAELVFYPSATPLRALVARSAPPATGLEWPRPTQPLDEAVAVWRDALANNPWLPAWPLGVGGCRLRTTPAGERWLESGEAALPLDPVQTDAAAMLEGLDGLEVHALLGRGCLSLLAANSALGRWWPD